MASKWPLPTSPTDARKKWGNNATVSIGIEQIAEQLGILLSVSYERARESREDRDARYWGYSTITTTKTPTAIRLSGHPDALLAMFRALHVEYAKKQRVVTKRRKKVRRSLLIGLDE